MKLLIAAVILSLYTLVPASGQSKIVGTWESDMDNEFSDELYIWQFRECGILLQTNTATAIWSASMHSSTR